MKLLGLTVIFISISSLGFFKSKELRRREELTLSLLKLLRTIRLEISTFCSPLDKIYMSFSDEKLEAIEFTGLLKKVGMSEALKAKRDELLLTDETFELLMSFSSQLGKSLSDEQIRHCDRYIAQLSEMASKLSRELKDKCKTAKTLSFSAAAMITLLLI